MRIMGRSLKKSRPLAAGLGVVVHRVLLIDPVVRPKAS
jgi:hypothetical protein